MKNAGNQKPKVMRGNQIFSLFKHSGLQIQKQKMPVTQGSA